MAEADKRFTMDEVVRLLGVGTERYLEYRGSYHKSGDIHAGKGDRIVEAAQLEANSVGWLAVASYNRRVKNGFMSDRDMPPQHFPSSFTLLKIATLIVVMLLISACGTRPYQRPFYTEFVQSIPPLESGYGRVFFYNVTLQGSPSISIDGKYVSIFESAYRSFFYIDLPRGEHAVTGHFIFGKKASLDMSILDGETLYIEVSMRDLYLIDEQHGKYEIMKNRFYYHSLQ